MLFLSLAFRLSLTTCLRGCLFSLYLFLLHTSLTFKSAVNSLFTLLFSHLFSPLNILVCTVFFCFPNNLLSLHLTLSPLAYGSNTGVYGDVQRVKILYNKKDSALIQMSDANQAQLGEHISALSEHKVQLLSCLLYFLVFFVLCITKRKFCFAYTPLWDQCSY